MPSLPSTKPRLASINHLHLVVSKVFCGQRPHHFVALIIEAAKPARLMPGQSVVSEDGHSDGGIGVADDGVRELGRVHFAPTDSLAGGRPGEAASLGPRLGDL